MKRLSFSCVIALSLTLSVALVVPPKTVASLGEQERKSEWISLFDGKTLKGWDTWLGYPRTKGQKQRLPLVGLNKDPKKVYTVVQFEGKPAIRISGEIFGALTSKKEFGNYHLKLQFKWGKKKWFPRENARRDSGLLYHCVGKHNGRGGSNWLESHECQIQEHDCGDYWGVGAAIVTVEGIKKGNTVYYKKGGMKFRAPSKGVSRHIVKDGDYEKFDGSWNTIEVFAVDDKAIHIVNGKVVMRLSGLSRRDNGKVVPLIKGKLQIQSEGAEVYYREMMIRLVDQIPKKLWEE
ncbi:MAG: DUF1080 domain-containing protein [Gemmataceae bacterium]